MKPQTPFNAENLLQAHAALAQDVRKLEDKLRHETSAEMTELRAELSTTQKHVLDHFYFEAQSGYLDMVRYREPRLQHAVEELEDEHHQLLGTLASLREKVYATAVLDTGLRASIQDWINSLRHHEARENALVQDAFNVDVGAEA